MFGCREELVKLPTAMNELFTDIRMTLEKGALKGNAYFL